MSDPSDPTDLTVPSFDRVVDVSDDEVLDPDFNPLHVREGKSVEMPDVTGLPDSIRVLDPLELARAVNTAIRDYERACDDHRIAESKRLYGHSGASIGTARPTEAGRVEAAAVVIRRYLGAESGT